MSSRSLRRRTESGVALISVLWILLLLSALAAATQYVARTNAVLTHRSLEIAQAEAAADAAIIDTVVKLSDEQVTRHLSTHNGLRTWEFASVPVSVSITQESGRLDLNAADDDLMVAFLQSQGVTKETAAVLLDALRDWQDADSIARDHGAEIAQYQARGEKVSPRNGRLESTDELRQIPTWAAQPLDCWLDSLTVYTGSPSVSLRDATPKAMAALRWAEEHHLGDREWIPADRAAANASFMEPSVIGDVLRLRVRATVSENVSVTREWVGRLTGNVREPMMTMRWDNLAGHNVVTKCEAVNR